MEAQRTASRAAAEARAAEGARDEEGRRVAQARAALDSLALGGAADAAPVPKR